MLSAVDEDPAARIFSLIFRSTYFAYFYNLKVIIDIRNKIVFLITSNSSLTRRHPSTVQRCREKTADRHGGRCAQEE